MARAAVQHLGDVRELERQLAATQGAQALHERVCEERMVRIDERHETTSRDIGEIKDSVAAVLGRMDGFTGRMNAAAWKVNWKAWAVAISIISGLAGALALETGQLYGLRLSPHADSPK